MASPLHTRSFISTVSTIIIGALIERMEPEDLALTTFQDTINTLMLLVNGFIHNLNISDAIHLNLNSLAFEIHSMFVIIRDFYINAERHELSEIENSDDSMSPEYIPNNWTVNGNVEWTPVIEQDELDSASIDIMPIWNSISTSPPPWAPPAPEF